MSKLAAPLLVALLASPVGAADLAFTVPLPGRGAFQLDVPAEWKAEVRGPADLPPTIAFLMPSGAKVLITPIYDPRSPAAKLDETFAREGIERSRDELLAGSVEKELTVQVRAGSRNTVRWFTATDRAPKPGEFERLTMGSALVGGEVVAFFTLLHHVDKPPEREVVLGALGGARLVPAEAVQPKVRPPVDPYALAWPGEDWALLADLPGFVMGEVERSEGGNALRVFGSNATSRINASLILIRFEGATPELCREAHGVAMKRLPQERTQERAWERPGLAAAEYTNPQVKGKEIRQRHLQAYLAAKDTCASLHLSKVLWEPADQPLFDALVKGVRVGAPAGR